MTERTEVTERVNPLTSNYVVVAFYTRESVYEQFTQTLADSAKLFDIPFMAYECEDRGSWMLNHNIKPEIILQAMGELYPSNILYIDSDAIIRKPLTLLDAQYDFDLGAIWVTAKRRGKKVQVISDGTIWVRNIREVGRYIEAWRDHVKANPQLFEQEEFGLIYKTAMLENRIRVDPAFPAEYCMVCLPDKNGKMIPIDDNVRYEDVVIEQGRNFNKPWGLKR